MTPTRIYVKSVLPLIKAGLVEGGAHITGGGLIENPPRAIAEGLAPRFDWNAWPLPPVFAWLQAVGGVSDHEMRRTFNCGVGFILIVKAEQRRAGAGRAARRGRDGLRLRRARSRREPSARRCPAVGPRLRRPGPDRGRPRGGLSGGDRPGAVQQPRRAGPGHGRRRRRRRPWPSTIARSARTARRTSGRSTRPCARPASSSSPWPATCAS